MRSTNDATVSARTYDNALRRWGVSRTRQNLSGRMPELRFWLARRLGRFPRRLDTLDLHHRRRSTKWAGLAAFDQHFLDGCISKGRFCFGRCVVQTTMKRAQCGVSLESQRTGLDTSERIDGFDDIPHGDLCRRPRERKASAASSLRMNQPRPHKLLHQLEQIRSRHARYLGDLLTRHRFIMPIAQSHDRAKCVFDRLRNHGPVSEA